MKVQTDLKAGGGLGALINAIVIVDLNLFGGGSGGSKKPC
jgi:hypothetical protein